jgi:hypothetical protein
LGNAELAPAIEARLLGLAEGEHVSFDMAAGEAFGERNPDMLQWVPKQLLSTFGDADASYLLGEVVEFPAPNNEGKYDTRSTEASYLARGLAFRIADLRPVVAWFQLFDASWRSAVVQAGALIQLDDDLLFMAPVGGGRVRVGDRTVTIISPASPLGEALAGLEPGDVAEIDSPRGILSREVRAIA